MNFDELFDRWTQAEEVDPETLQLIRDTVRFIKEIGDEELADRAGDLLSTVYHLAVDTEDVQKIAEALSAYMAEDLESS